MALIAITLNFRVYVERMYVARVPNRKSPPAILLRESYRENGKVKSRTLANLSKLPESIIELIQRSLKGEKLVPLNETFEIVGSLHHGHVSAVLTAMKRLDLPGLIAPRSSRIRRLVLALIASRILQPASKLATTRSWNTTTLPAELNIVGADENELYAAMDWLYDRQESIEDTLADRHLENGSLALYDLSSSYFEGSQCPLACLGYSRDRKKGKLQVNYGLMTNENGVPISISVYDGNIGDSTTVLDQVDKLQNKFGLNRVVLVGDRGMISQKQIDVFAEMDGVDWVTALRSSAIQKLLADKHITLDMFAAQGFFELSHPDFPNERLVACRNPALAKRREKKRDSLLSATTDALDKLQARVKNGHLKGAAKIGVQTGKVINRYNMSKHIQLDIKNQSIDYTLDVARISKESASDGIFVIRTSVKKDRLNESQVVLTYKLLTQVERAFRSIKTVDIKIRPIHHRTEKRVRTHIFLCMLAYYVQRHMLEAWRPLMFSDEEQDSKAQRHPVAPARRSDSAMEKVQSHKLEDGTPVQSFQTLLGSLSTIVRNTCRPKGCSNANSFEITTTPDESQRRAFELLSAIAA